MTKPAPRRSIIVSRRLIIVCSALFVLFLLVGTMVDFVFWLFFLSFFIIPFMITFKVLNIHCGSSVKKWPVKLFSYFSEHPISSIILVTVVVAKFVLSVLATLSIDFINFFMAGTGLRSFNDAVGPFMALFLVLNGMYRLWLLAPIKHPPATSIYPGVPRWTVFVPSFSSELLIFLFKLPLLIFDLLSAFLIYHVVFHFTGSKESSQLSLVVWLCNPYVTLMSEMFGTVDVIAAFYVLACVFFFVKSNISLSALCLTFGGIVRWYPFLLTPIFLICLLRKGKVKDALSFVSYTLLAIAIFALSLVVLVDFDGLVRLLYSVLAQPDVKFFFGPVVAGMGGISPMGLTVVLCVVYIFILFRVWKLDANEGVVDALFGFMLAMFAFSYFNPQFLVWVIPFLTLDFVLNRRHWVYPLAFILTPFLWHLSLVGWYFSSDGHSVFFIPNYTREMVYISHFILHLCENVWFQAIAYEFLLKSIFAGICIIYLINLTLKNRQ